MVAKIIDGNAVARQVRQECKQETEALKAQGVVPGLAVIIVGDNPASKVYVANKVRACTEVGLASTVHAFAADTPDTLVEARIAQLNADPAVHGILVQLPLPPHYDVRRVLAAISVDKDVDGFHLYNVGALAQGETVFPPCTPYGVSKMLEFENIPVAGQNVVVVGASNIVGKPMAHDADAARRHRLHLPRQDPRPGAVHHPGRHSGSGRWRAQLDTAADGAYRRGGDRRRHQPPARWPPGGRCGL